MNRINFFYALRLPAVSWVGTKLDLDRCKLSIPAPHFYVSFRVPQPQYFSRRKFSTRTTQTETSKLTEANKALHFTSDGMGSNLKF